MILYKEMKDLEKPNLLYSLLNAFRQKFNIKKNNIFYSLYPEELKCPDFIGRQSLTNCSKPGKELIEWKNSFLSNEIENVGVVVLGALDKALAIVTERLN